MIRILRIVASKLIRWFYPYVSVRTVLLGPLEGFRFVVAPSIGLTFVFGVDSMSWKFMQSKISAGDVVDDIGANRGQMALFFSKIVGSAGQVFAFELMPELIDVADKNVRLNKCDNIHLHNFAIAGEDGVALFELF